MKHRDFKEEPEWKKKKRKKRMKVRTLHRKQNKGKKLTKEQETFLTDRRL